MILPADDPRLGDTTFAPAFANAPRLLTKTWLADTATTQI